MKLWDDELESYREEARSLLPHLPDISLKEIPSDPIERAVAQRAAMSAIMTAQPSELAEEATIPGPAGDIPVRIFRPQGKARGLFLHQGHDQGGINSPGEKRPQRNIRNHTRSNRVSESLFQTLRALVERRERVGRTPYIDHVPVLFSSGLR